MDTVLVVNAGSSSIKFQVFGTEGRGGFVRLVKGQIDGIGTRPRLRATSADGNTLVDRSYEGWQSSVPGRSSRWDARGCPNARLRHREACSSRAAQKGHCQPYRTEPGNPKADDVRTFRGRTRPAGDIDRANSRGRVRAWWRANADRARYCGRKGRSASK